jgi:outer membrane receptor protein involved in Fe transport
MKKFYYLLTYFLITTVGVANAENEKGNVKITGTVVDSLLQKPVEFANIALMKSDSNTPIDGAIADNKGNFTISKVAPGDYKVVVSFIGFESRTISVSVDDKKDVDLGTVIISPTDKVLKEVTVEGQKALFEEKVDRTVYNAENDATAKGGDATDVLKRVPMLSVDMDGNVSLRGNQNIMVLINNKPSTIMASSIPDALKQIPADQIKTVEVITSPSSKYDAEGSAGIINIITKKNTLEGLTLNVDTGIGLRGSNLGLNGNYRKGKMGFSLGGFGRANYNIKGSNSNVQRFTRQDLPEMLVRQSADTRNQGLFGHYNLGWDYDIDKKNSLTASVRFGVRNHNNYQDNLTRETYQSDVLSSSSIADVDSRNRNNNVDANFTYTHYYTKPQRELSFQGLYSRNNGNNEFENIYDYTTGSDISFLNINDSYNQEVTFQGDYQTPISTNQMLEFGGKTIMRKVLSDFETFKATGADGSYELDSEGGLLSNNLNYDQNVTAGYFSYTYSTKGGVSVKAGSRYEYTTIEAFTETENDIDIPSYGVLVPSINVSKRLKNGNTLKASYNRRIQRPSIRFLNPNIQWQNDANVTQGNPNLDPEYTNNYELSYSTLIKGTMLNFSTFVRNTTGGIQSVRDLYEIEDKTVNRTTFRNIGNEDAYGASVFANINIGKLSLNGGGDVFYAMLNNNSPDPNVAASNEGWVVSGRLFGNYTLNKGWGLQLFSFYRGNRVDLQGQQGGFYMYSVAVRKEFNEKRGSVGIGIENFLQEYIRIKSTVETPTLQQTNINKMYNSSIRLNFSYRIGKMSMDQQPRRSRRSINNDDLKDGGDNNMGGDQGGGQQQPQRGGGGFTPQMGGQRPGQGQQQKPAEVKPDTSSAVFEAAGTWNYTIDSPQGGNGTIVINNDNGTYTGTIKNARMPEATTLANVVVKGNDVSFSYPVNFGGNSSTVEVKYRVNKDAITGTMNIGNFRSFNLTGTRGQ